MHKLTFLVTGNVFLINSEETSSFHDEVDKMNIVGNDASLMNVKIPTQKCKIPLLTFRKPNQ